MMAAVAASVAQFSQGETSANTSGTGADHRIPNTDNTIGGTHSQCNSLLVGLVWLDPYSPSQSVTVRMPPTLRLPVWRGNRRSAPSRRLSAPPKEKPGVFANAGLPYEHERFYDRVAAA